MLTLYGRTECHLCDEMLTALESVLPKGIAIDLIDISGDDELEARYGLRIPVLCAGDVELSCYVLDPACVREWLASCRHSAGSVD